MNEDRMQHDNFKDHPGKEAWKEMTGDDLPKIRPSVREVNPLTNSRAKRFHLVRDEDETGISGCGVVAEGIEFSNGYCAMSWLTAMHSIAIYPNIRQLEAIHGHNGRTRVVFESAVPSGERAT